MPCPATVSGPASLIPADRADARLLLDAHVVLKALYEVRYELSNRPCVGRLATGGRRPDDRRRAAGVTGGS